MLVVSEAVQKREVLVLRDECKRLVRPKKEARADLIVRKITFSIMDSWTRDCELIYGFYRKFSCAKILKDKLSSDITCNLFESLNG